jgi:acetylornithine deacetylase
MMARQAEKLEAQAVGLLKELIAIPSLSRKEDKTADLIQRFLEAHGVEVHRFANNVWARSRRFDPARPTLLLNSHHDTVPPNPAYGRDPYKPSEEDGRIYGLGSNDAGGALVSLIAAFLHFEETPPPFNLVLAVSAEEEVSGKDGIERLYPQLPRITCGIVGEPTLDQLAIAERGLMVLDCLAKGKAGHAAREEGVNALYQALPDIEWFRRYSFPRRSETLGEVKMGVTVIQAGQQHNQVPAECRFTADVRVPDCYTLEEVLEEIRKNVRSEVTPRSLRLRSKGLDPGHPFIAAGRRLGLRMYGSPTTSDQALIPVPTVKMGPGDSARSHMADEYIYRKEIGDGIQNYIRFIRALEL